MLQRRRVMPFALLAVTMSVAAAAAPAVAAAGSPTAIEVEIADLVNAERRARGAPPLRVDVRLVAAARAWSTRMARDGRLAHDPDLGASVPLDASAYAETVGRTSASQDAARRLHAQFMASALHRGVLLDSRYTDLGVGVATGAGRTYVTQRFTAGAPAHVAEAVTPAAELAEALFGAGRAGHAVVARDDVFPDALAAGPLAGAEGPVALSPPGPALHPRVRLALERTLPRGRTVWLVGGTAAVSSGVEHELAGAGWDVRRLAGGNRIETAARVSRSVVSRDGRPDSALVATAAGWPDAAAGGAFGAARRAPVLLGQRDVVPGDTAAALRDFRPRSLAALGGSEVLGDAVVRSIGARRVAGPSRQGTSAAIAEQLWGYTDAAAATWIAVPGFGGDAWTWALSAAPLAARHDAAVLLVGDPLSSEVRDYLRGLGYGAGRSARLLTYGPVPAGVAAELNLLLGN